MTIIQDLGQWAEDAFAGLCAEAGVTRNRSAQDRTGWDSLVEFPPPPTPGVPADLRPPPQLAWIQIKSKQRGKPTARLKLSNALRFATDPNPCFLVLFLATEGAKPVRIFARHIWTDEIETILRRVRTADAQGREDLHKLEMQIGLRASDDHTDDLVAWMRDTIRGAPSEYTDAKRQITGSVGLGDGSIFGSFSFLESDLEALVDHQLGLPVEAPVAQVTIRHRRFGIEAPQPLVSAKPDFALLRVEPRAGRVRLRRPGFADVWLPAELRAPTLPDLPPGLRKLRVTADFLDCVEAEGRGSARLSYAREAPRSLESLRSLLDGLAMFDDGPVDMSIYVDGALMSGVWLDLPRGSEPFGHPHLSLALACLEGPCAQVAPPDVAFSLIDLHAARAEILGFSDLTTGKALSVRLNCDQPPPPGPVDVVRFLSFGAVSVGGWTFMALVNRPVIEAHAAGATVSFTCGEPQVVEAMVRQGTPRQHRPDLEALYRATVGRMGHGTIELFGGDFAAMQAALRVPPLPSD